MVEKARGKAGRHLFWGAPEGLRICSKSSVLHLPVEAHRGSVYSSTHCWGKSERTWSAGWNQSLFFNNFQGAFTFSYSCQVKQSLLGIKNLATRSRKRHWKWYLCHWLKKLKGCSSFQINFEWSPWRISQ